VVAVVVLVHPGKTAELVIPFKVAMVVPVSLQASQDRRLVALEAVVEVHATLNCQHRRLVLAAVVMLGLLTMTLVQTAPSILAAAAVVVSGMAAVAAMAARASSLFGIRSKGMRYGLLRTD